MKSRQQTIRYLWLLFGCCGSLPVCQHTFNSTCRIPFLHVARQHKLLLSAETSAFDGLRCTGRKKKKKKAWTHEFRQSDSQRSYNGRKEGGGASAEALKWNTNRGQKYITEGSSRLLCKTGCTLLNDEWAASPRLAMLGEIMKLITCYLCARPQVAADACSPRETKRSPTILQTEPKKKWSLPVCVCVSLLAMATASVLRITCQRGSRWYPASPGGGLTCHTSGAAPAHANANASRSANCQRRDNAKTHLITWHVVQLDLFYKFLFKNLCPHADPRCDINISHWNDHAHSKR